MCLITCTERQRRKVVFTVQNEGHLPERYVDEFSGTIDEFASYMQKKWEYLHGQYLYVDLISTAVLPPDSRLDVGTFPLPVPH